MCIQPLLVPRRHLIAFGGARVCVSLVARRLHAAVPEGQNEHSPGFSRGDANTQVLVYRRLPRFPARAVSLKP